MTDQTHEPRRKSATALLSDLTTHVRSLMRKEVDLVRAELSESATKAAVAIGLIVGAVIFVLVALNVLSAALVAGIAELGIEEGWAALIVGAVYFVIALILVRKGSNDLKATSLAPTRTVKSVRADAHAVKETFHGQR